MGHGASGSCLVSYLSLPGIAVEGLRRFRAYDPAIHHSRIIAFCEDRWIRGSSPRMTTECEARANFASVRDFSLFFILSKTLGFMLLPTNFLIGVGVVGAILLADAICIARPQAGDRVACCCWRSAGFRRSETSCSIRWSSAFRRGMPRAARRTASSCSAASIEADLSAAHGTPVVRSAPDRIIAAAALAHRYPNARIVFSGGSANLISNDAQGSRFRRRRSSKVSASPNRA